MNEREERRVFAMIIVIFTIIVDTFCLFACLYWPGRGWPLILCLFISWLCASMVKNSGVIE